MDIEVDVAAGNAGDADAALGHPEVYAELRRLARRQLARGRPGQTLNTTALVHEAWLRLRRPSASAPLDHAHALNLAALAMRQIVCDYARRRLLERAHIETRDAEALDAVAAELQEAQRLVQVDEALRQLAEREPRQAQIVVCRFFAGLTEDETALAVDAPLRTVQREWASAREWLRGRMA